jgi:ribulose-bisphosphate carboxylase large chain
MAVQLDYIAPKGWKPSNPDEDWLITYIDIELADGIDESVFPDAAASCAAESSTGTWTKVYDGADSGVPMADKMKALAYDLEPETKTFKIAYPIDLFEYDNISGMLAGFAGNLAGMKMLKAFRLLDVRFPRKIVEALPGPAFGVEGVREMIGRNAKEQASLAHTLFTAAQGRYHGIKDDENLTNLKFNKFEDRCRMIHKVRREIEEKTGNKKFYLCNVTHSNIDTMLERCDMIKKEGGRWMMIDVVTTGFAAVHSMRLKNPGLAIHAHRAMHALMDRDSGPGVNDKGEIHSFSASMIVLAKIMRLLGVDSLHGGSTKTKMENYDEALTIKNILQEDITEPTETTLGQNWFGMKPVLHTASGGLHSGTVPAVMKQLGEDLIIQAGGGALGHPWGIEAGVEAMVQAVDLSMNRGEIKDWVEANPDSSLAKAAQHWGFDPRIVY